MAFDETQLATESTLSIAVYSAEEKVGAWLLPQVSLLFSFLAVVAGVFLIVWCRLGPSSTRVFTCLSGGNFWLGGSYCQVQCQAQQQVQASMVGKHVVIFCS